MADAPVRELAVRPGGRVLLFGYAQDAEKISNCGERRTGIAADQGNGAHGANGERRGRNADGEAAGCPLAESAALHPTPEPANARQSQADRVLGELREDAGCDDGDKDAAQRAAACDSEVEVRQMLLIRARSR